MGTTAAARRHVLIRTSCALLHHTDPPCNYKTMGAPAVPSGTARSAMSIATCNGRPSLHKNQTMKSRSRTSLSATASFLRVQLRVGRLVQPDRLRPCWFHRARFHSLVPQELPELWAMVRKFDIYRSRTYTICTVVCRNRNFWTMVRKFDISRFRRYRLGTARKSTFWVRNFLWRIALSCGGST